MKVFESICDFNKKCILLGRLKHPTIMSKRNHLKLKNKITSEKGLSLLEVAIGVVIIGLIAIPVLELNKINRMKNDYYTTSAALDTSLDAINISFIVGYNAYACPASLTAKEGDSDYGVSNACVLSDIKNCTGNSWKTNGGVCKTTNTSSSAVIIGAVPFATLNIQYTDTLDQWGNKLIYAVSYEQTNPTTYEDGKGVITLITADNPKLVADATAPYSSDEDGVPDAVTTPYDLVIISTGRTGNGGFDQNGNERAACADAADSYDSENCDFDSIFFAEKHPSDLWANAVNYNQSSNEFFDDQTVAQASIPQGTWFQHPDNLSYANQYAITTAEKIGIGTAEPHDNATIDVAGNIRIEKDPDTANTGFLKTESLCSDTETAGTGFSTCFNPEIITYESAEMNCDYNDEMYGDQPALKFANGSIYCGTADEYGSPTANRILLKASTSTLGSITCGSGQLITGFSATGVASCLDIY